MEMEMISWKSYRIDFFKNILEFKERMKIY